MEISEKHIWVDSQCVLNWINNKRTLGTFVENRVKEIKRDKDTKLHYISTKENPADMASRGTGTQELKDNKLLWHGPKWLTNSEQDWPEWQPELTDKQREKVRTQIESEYRKTRVMFEAKLVAGEGSKDERNVEIKTPYGIDIRRFSSLTKLLRVTALSERFVNKLRKKSNRSGPLDESEIANAERSWTMYVQRDHFGEIIESIQKAQLEIRMDTKGLLRRHGRLENAEISDGASQPILLPKTSRHGPEWLVQPQQTWPECKRASTGQEETEIQSQTESEVRKTKLILEAKLVAEKGSPELKEKTFNIDVERFSSFTNLVGQQHGL